MSDGKQVVQRRWRRHRVVIGLGFTIAVLLIAIAGWRSWKTRRLRTEIYAAGGWVTLPRPLTQKVRGWWLGRSLNDQTIVWLDRNDIPGILRFAEGVNSSTLKQTTQTIDSAWLRDHGYLDELKINHLYVSSPKIAGTDIARLISGDPLEVLRAQQITEADVVAGSLSSAQQLASVDLENSDLTDQGLRRLPLEQLTFLNVAQTNVTALGLRDLAGCRRLMQLAIDGRQFDPSIAELLPGLESLYCLFLNGTDVVDGHLALLNSKNLKVVVLDSTSATAQGIQTLQKRLPNCSVRTRE